MRSCESVLLSGSVRRSELFPQGLVEPLGAWEPAASAPSSPQHKPDSAFFSQIKRVNYNYGLSGLVEGTVGPLAKSPNLQPRSLRLSEALAPSTEQHTWGRHPNTSFPNVCANHTGLPAPQWLVRLEKACEFLQKQLVHWEGLWVPHWVPPLP